MQLPKAARRAIDKPPARLAIYPVNDESLG
jgi:hypothetical protein